MFLWTKLSTWVYLPSVISYHRVNIVRLKYHINVSEQVISTTETAYCKIKTASYNSYYNHDDIRAVHLDKAPWNDWFFSMTVLSFVVMLYGLTDGFADEEKTSKEGYKPSEALMYLGIAGLVLFLIYLVRLVCIYQYMRPKVYATIDTARWHR